jgi:hypothetical protein
VAVELGWPEPVVLRADPGVVVGVVAKARGAVALGTVVGVAGETVQPDRGGEQETRVTGGEKHLGVHRWLSALWGR